MLITCDEFNDEAFESDSELLLAEAHPLGKIAFLILATYAII